MDKKTYYINANYKGLMKNYISERIYISRKIRISNDTIDFMCLWGLKDEAPMEVSNLSVSFEPLYPVLRDGWEKEYPRLFPKSFWDGPPVYDIPKDVALSHGHMCYMAAEYERRRG